MSQTKLNFIVVLPLISSSELDLAFGLIDFKSIGICLLTMINDFASPTIIRASAAKARAVLNKYYAKTDDSKMYQLCMSRLFCLTVFRSILIISFFVVLHPKFKMTYFNKENWQPDWIDTARQLLRDEWNKYYKPTIDVSFLEEAGPTMSSSNPVSLCL